MSLIATSIRNDCPQFEEFTAAAAVSPGQVVQLPSGRAGVVAGLEALAAGDKGVAYVNGQYRVNKTASVAILKGGDVFFDTSASKADFHMDGGDYRLGVALANAAAAGTTVDVDLNAQQEWFLQLGESCFASVAVQTTGAPAVTEVVAGQKELKFVLDTQTEAQKIDLLSVDSIPVTTGFIAEFVVAIYDVGDSNTLDINFGVANGTHASDCDSITESVFFHVDGNALDVFAESDDGTTEVTATDTTVNAVDDTYAHYWIDARDLSDVQLYINGVNVLPSSVFDVSAATGPLKALVHVEKSSNDTPADVRIKGLRIRTMDSASLA